VLGLLAQHGLADDALDIGVRQLHLDGEAGLQAFAVPAWRCAGPDWPVAHQQQSAAQIGADVVGNLLHIVGALHLVADELLDLVDDEQRAGHLPVLAEDLL